MVDVVEKPAANCCASRSASFALVSATLRRESPSPYLPAAVSAIERLYWASDAKYFAFVCDFRQRCLSPRGQGPACAHLNQQTPLLDEDALGDPLFRILGDGGVRARSLHAHLAPQPGAFRRRGTHRLDENLDGLGRHEADEDLDDLFRQVGRGRVQKVLVDVDKHARGGAERVERALESLGRRAGRRRRERRQGRAHVENDGSFLVRERLLRDLDVGKRVTPAIENRDMRSVTRREQVEKGPEKGETDQGNGTLNSGNLNSSNSSWPKYLYNRSLAVASDPAEPLRASWRVRFSCESSSAYVSGLSEYVFAMIDRSDGAKSTSWVTFFGTRRGEPRRLVRTRSRTRFEQRRRDDVPNTSGAEDVMPQLCRSA